MKYTFSCFCPPQELLASRNNLGRLQIKSDLLNSRIHIEDRDFALEQGILPLHETKGKIREQFLRLGELAEISEKQLHKMLDNLTSHSDEVKALIQRSYLSERTKRNYEQAYLTRLNKLMRE